MNRIESFGPNACVDWLDAERATDAQLAEATRWLTPDEHARLARFKVAHAARDYLLGRWLARRALADHTGVAPSQWSFELSRHGRPMPQAQGVSAAPDLNLSHGGGLVVCACAAGLEVGVDVESVDRPMPRAGLERFLPQGELASLRAVPAAQRCDRLWRLWTLKEALLKAMGTGFAGKLAAAEIRLDGPGPPCPADPAQRARWTLFELRPTSRHRLALALTATPQPAQIRLLQVGPSAR